MNEASEKLDQLYREHRDLFHERQVIMSFSNFLNIVETSPRLMVRNSAQYLIDTFNYEGCSEIRDELKSGLTRFRLFDIGTEQNGAVVGGESVQSDIFTALNAFARQGIANKMILLHGPNGSAKSSTVEAIGNAMTRYSKTQAGAIYRFNWIFPTERSPDSYMKGEQGAIGFGTAAKGLSLGDSYATLDESQISSKILSEFSENPVYLIPMPAREKWLRQWIAAKEGCSVDEVELPPHILQSGLSKRNQLIIENLLAAYDGDLSKVFRHVQIERFFFSRQYRVGISTVEPQMSVDAHEKQLTMDKNIANLPNVLHNVRFFEAQGELVEANRGIIEFSDLLKRPVEAFKYLLSTVEKGSLSLPSSTANLDVVFLGTTNEKHLDAFKTLPDFSSFRSRFELITVPYLLNSVEEQQIYSRDIEAIGKSYEICPHSLELLCTWAVMTRLKQPDPEYYDSMHRSLISRLDPRHKVKLYEGKSLRPKFTPEECRILLDLRRTIFTESNGLVVYEGRFGASPREIRGILHRAANNPNHKFLSPMAVFDELERMIKDRTIYEFLQFEPRGKYHDASQFLTIIKDEFADIFEAETLKSMSLVEEEEYEKLIVRYIQNVVATVKGEKVYNQATQSYEPPSKVIMERIEKIVGVSGPVDKYRQSLISSLAAYKIENPDREVHIPSVFADILHKVENYYYNQQRKIVEKNFTAMLKLGGEEERNLSEEDKNQAQNTFQQLEQRFGYSRKAALACLRYLKFHEKKSS